MRRALLIVGIAAVAALALPWHTEVGGSSTKEEGGHGAASTAAREGPTLVSGPPRARPTPPSKDASPKSAPASPLRVAFDVRLSTGEVPDRAWVYFRAEDAYRVLEWTPERPAIGIPADATYVLAMGGRMGEWISEGIQLSQGRSRLAVVLEPHRCILGRVVATETGAPLPVAVRCRRTDAPGQEALSAERWAVDPVRDDGWFRIDLEPASGDALAHYRIVAATSRDGLVVAEAEVDVGRGPAEVELRVPLLDRTRGVGLCVTGPEGLGLHPDWIHLASPDWDAPLWIKPDGYLRVDDETIWVPLRAGRSTVPLRSPMELRISSFRLGEQRVVVDAASSAAPVQVRFSEPCTLQLTLPGFHPESEGLMGLWTSSATGQAEHFSAFGSPSDSNHSHEFGPLQPGVYRAVWSQITTPAPPGEWVGRVDLGEVTVRSGSHSATLPLQPFTQTTVRGRTPGQISIRSREGSSVSWRTQAPHDADPWSVASPPLPPGEYEARLGDVRRSFTVPGTTEIVFDD